MDIVTYQKEIGRMCETYPLCEGCPISDIVGYCDLTTISENSDKVLAAVEKWSKEHQTKTNGELVLAEMNDGIVAQRDELYVEESLFDGQRTEHPVKTIMFDQKWWNSEFKDC